MIAITYNISATLSCPATTKQLLLTTLSAVALVATYWEGLGVLVAH